MARTFSGSRLREHRLQAGLSPERLALLSECSVYSVHELERGRRCPSANALGRLADALDCSIDALYVDEEALADVA